MDKPITPTFRTFLLATLVVGFALASGCGRTAMDVLAVASNDAGGADHGTSGVCGEAFCLTSLFQTCVPEGDCFVQGGGSPSASFSDICYSNGITVFTEGTYNYTNSNAVGTVTVSRNRALCYNIDTFEGGAVSYVITDGRNQQVATGIPGNDPRNVIVTCNGSSPTTVSYACLNPTFDSSKCTLHACP